MVGKGIEDQEVGKLKHGIMGILTQKEGAEKMGFVFEGEKVGCKMENFVALGFK